MKKLLVIIFSFSFVFTQHFSVDIQETGESCLFIFEDSITSLNTGDQVGLFDENGIIDSDGNIGEILVGAGTWTGMQLEVVAIQGVDLSQFGGPVLPGADSGNTMTLKVWKLSDETEYTVGYDISTGSGTFDSLFSAILANFLIPEPRPVFLQSKTREIGRSINLPEFCWSSFGKVVFRVSENRSKPWLL